MKRTKLILLFIVCIQGVIGCTSATRPAEKDVAEKPLVQAGSSGPTLTAEQAAEFKASLGKKGKKSAKGDE